MPLFEGLLPIERSGIPVDVVAGVTLAALAIPEVMGYTQIAGMPVITGLYTILLPLLAFGILGSSRHLVVGADSATAAVMAAALAGLAATGSSQYIALAGLLAVMTGVFLIVARLARLGFLADFLSRTVLIGFLTGVGIQVACGQVGEMLGVPSGSGGTIRKLFGTLGNIGDTSMTTLAVTASVMLVMVGLPHLTRKIPAALLAVIGSIFVSWAFDLATHGVATLGKLPGGLPSFGFPDVSWSDVGPLVATAFSILVLVLAQSAATSRAYASRYDEAFNENHDLVGLGAANIFAGLSGAFVVNGSPTKTQMVDGAGGRSQVAQLTTGAIVLIVLLFLTGPIQYMPKAVLAAVVFLIGVELVDLKGMARVLRMQVDEFVVATATAVVVVVVGVEQAIVLAIIFSLIIHVRRSYEATNNVLVDVAQGRWRSAPVEPAARTFDGCVVYRFSGSLYYANSNRFLSEVTGFLTTTAQEPLEWVCVDGAAISDVDCTGGETIIQAHGELKEGGVRLVFAELPPSVRDDLDRYGVTDAIGEDAYFFTVFDALAAFQAAHPSPPNP